MAQADESHSGWELYPPLSESIGPTTPWPGLWVIGGLLILVAVLARFLAYRRKFTALAVLASAVAAPLLALGWTWFDQYRPRRFGPEFFDTSSNDGGDPLLFQHWGWMLGHPEVWALILKIFLFCLGLVWIGRCLVSRGRYLSLAGFIASAVAFFTWMVWWMGRTTDLFAQGRGAEVDRLFNPYFFVTLGAWAMLAVLLVRIWRAGSDHPVSYLFLLSGAAFALVGAVSNVMLSLAGRGNILHEAYYAIPHRGYVIQLLLPLVIFCLGYRVWERFLGVPPNRYLALAHWMMTTAGIVLMFLPDLFFSVNGFPQRYAAELMGGVHRWEFVSHAGAIVTLISLSVFAICLIEAISRRRQIQTS